MAFGMINECQESEHQELAQRASVDVQRKCIFFLNYQGKSWIKTWSIISPTTNFPVQAPPPSGITPWHPRQTCGVRSSESSSEERPRLGFSAWMTANASASCVCCAGERMGRGRCPAGRGSLHTILKHCRTRTHTISENI